MSVAADVIGGGFLFVSAYCARRGMNLWSRHLDHKHESEVERAHQQRIESSVRLEIEQNRAMAEIEQMKEHPELSRAADSAIEPEVESKPDDPRSYVCDCKASPVPHIHTFEKNREGIMPVAPGLLKQARRGDFGGWQLNGRPLREIPMLRPKK